MGLILIEAKTNHLDLINRQHQEHQQRKRRSKAVPVLAVAGVSWSLASGASAASGMPAADMLKWNARVSHEVTLCEEDISDVSLATFYLFDNENGGIFRPRVRLAMGGCGCGGGILCGEVSTSTDYGTSTLGRPSYSIRPARKYAHTAKRRHVPKNF